MKSRILIVALIIALHPLIEGQSSCSGQLRSGDPEAADTAAEVYVDQGVLSEGSAPGGVTSESGEIEGGGGDDGAEKIICQEPSVPEEEAGPICRQYLPEGADAYVLLSVDSVLANMEAIQSIGAFNKFMDQIGDAIQALDPNMNVKEFASKMDSVCFACVLKPTESPEEMLDTTSGMTVSKSIVGSCAEMVVVDVFKDVVQLPDMMANAGVDQIDDLGRYVFKHKERDFYAIQPADKVIVAGTAKIIAETQGAQAAYKGNLSSAASNLLGMAWPATISVLANDNAFPMLMSKSVFDYFAPVMRYVSLADEQKVSFLGAMNIADSVKLSVSIHDVEKAKASDNIKDALVIRSFYEMPNLEFLYVYQSLKKELGSKDSTEMGESSIQSDGAKKIEELRMKIKELESEALLIKEKIAKMDKNLADPNLSDAERKALEDSIDKAKLRINDLYNMIKRLKEEIAQIESQQIVK